MMKKYLVTGASGFIGCGIVNCLLESGHAVVALDNNFRGNTARLAKSINKKEKIEFIQADVRDTKAVKDAAKGVDGIIHLAYVNGTEFFYKMPDLVLEVGVGGMLSVLEACKENAVKELVLASSSEVYQTPTQIPTDETVPLSIPDVLNPRYSYGGGKIISELMALHIAPKFVDKVTIFRPHNVYGPNMGREHVVPQFILRAVDQIKKYPEGKVPFKIQGDGKQTRSFIYIDDFIKGFKHVLDYGEHLNIYHIGTEDEVTILDVFKTFYKIVDVNK